MVVSVALKLRRLISIVVTAGLMLTTGCDGQTILTGAVQDNDGKPVAGATVRLTQGAGPDSPFEETKTDESGRYSLDLIHAPGNSLMVLLVTKVGFREYRREFRSDQQSKQPKTIVLRP